jgi:hypothetical protein
MSNVDLGQLRVAYKDAVDDWVDTIQTLGRIAMRLIFKFVVFVRIGVFYFQCC